MKKAKFTSVLVAIAIILLFAVEILATIQLNQIG